MVGLTSGFHFNNGHCFVFLGGGGQAIAWGIYLKVGAFAWRPGGFIFSYRVAWTGKENGGLKFRTASFPVHGGRDYIFFRLSRNMATLVYWIESLTRLSVLTLNRSPDTGQPRSFDFLGGDGQAIAWGIFLKVGAFACPSGGLSGNINRWWEGGFFF